LSSFLSGPPLPTSLGRRPTTGIADLAELDPVEEKFEDEN
jgi:hypothetical protein